MMEEQKMMLEKQYSMKKIFETVLSTNQAIKEMRKGVSVEEIEKAREEMKEIKDAQKDMGDFFAEYAEQDEKIIGYAHELGKAIMVIVNKWDLIEKDDKTMDVYKKDLANSLKFLSYAKYLFISAKTGQRTHKVLEMAKECYDNYNKRIGTGILNDVISKAILMKEPPVVALKRLKVYYATQVATKPPKFVFFVNDVNARHFSYERYLENRLRDSFDFSGTGIQIEYRERKDK